MNVLRLISSLALAAMACLCFAYLLIFGLHVALTGVALFVAGVTLGGALLDAFDVLSRGGW